MTDELPPMTLNPIGIVRNEIRERSPANREWWAGLVSEIIIDSSLADALYGLEEFSHIVVLYWMHRVTSRTSPLKVRPRHKTEQPLLGFFATRSPNRPNPIGIATAKLLNRQGNILKVEGLDAIDGTPVIDIKPYMPGYDSADNMKVPQWVTKR